MPIVVAIANGGHFSPLVDAAIIVLPVVDAAATTDGPRECAVLPLVVVNSISNDADIPLALLLPPLPNASRVL
jgi:hypothetical protein